MPGYELIDENEAEAVAAVFRNGGVLFRHGFDDQRGGSYQVAEFERAFAERFGADEALAVSSGTAALRVALASFDIGFGDEVITQSFTFVATVEAIVEAGATPICAEVDETLNLDLEDLQHRITPRTRAIVAVHMLGNPCNIEELAQFCEANELILIEDTAWGCGGSFNGRLLGTFGDAGAFSFDHAKAITTGEGGMLIHRDRNLNRKARAWHDHGHENNPTLPRWKDSRTSSGFNFRMSELQGAVGTVQLTKLDSVLEGQRSTAQAIRRILHSGGIRRYRAEYPGASGTDDVVVAQFKTATESMFFRDCLIKHGLSSKILPEAISWHFAGFWEHIHQLHANHRPIEPATWERSFFLLSRCVAIPAPVFHDHHMADALSKAVATFNGNTSSR